MKATVFSKAVVMIGQLVMASVMELFCKRDNSCRLCEKRGDDRRTDDRQDYLPQ